jgi:hypothetical protein
VKANELMTLLMRFGAASLTNAMTASRAAAISARIPSLQAAGKSLRLLKQQKRQNKKWVQPRMQ